MIDSTIVRAHRCAAGEKTEEQNQALGRSRGGFSTKIHVRCNAAGLPIGVVLSEGEAHDVTAYDGLMEQRDSDPGAMLADKGYDSDAIEALALVFGALEHAGVDARQRTIVWADGKRLSIEHSTDRIHAGHPGVPRHLIETHVQGWLENCAPESYSERQLEELDRLIGPWLDDYERTSRAAKE